MIQHFFTKQFLLFVAIGGVAAVLNWLTRIALGFWIAFLPAVILAYAVGMVVAFTLNRAFVFPNSVKPVHHQARDFLIVNLVSFPVVVVAALLLELIFKWLGVTAHAQLAAHGVAVMIPAFVSFLAYKFFTFRESAREGI